MKSFKLVIEYDGTNYNGWQRQATEPTVQAIGQAAHFRCETRLDPEAILKGLNSLLPPDIAICDCRLVPADFHARFAAQSKIYRYRILNRAARAAVGRNYSWFIHRPLDVQAMQQAAHFIVGRHDFKAFESSGSPRAHTVRHVMAAQWVEEREQGLLTFQIEADGFLRGMVRNIVGALVAAGRGRIQPADIAAILASRDRRRAGAPAPPQGLVMVEVKY
jgi:tRNA pseudouridine38-40 synthase